MLLRERKFICRYKPHWSGDWTQPQQVVVMVLGLTITIKVTFGHKRRSRLAVEKANTLDEVQLNDASPLLTFCSSTVIFRHKAHRQFSTLVTIEIPAERIWFWGLGYRPAN